VRRLHNDITFLDEFFTFDFCVEQKFYSFGWNDKASTYEIQSREFAKVKEQLLRSLTNRGQPFIYVEDGNHDNKAELLLRHRHDGVDLDLGQAKDTLKALAKVWTRPVNLLTKLDGKGKLIRCDGEALSEKAAEYTS